MSKPVNLVINADDFGISEAVNRSILRCFHAGSVSSTTLMVNQPATEEAALIAREEDRIGVGLHFNLTLGEPVCKKRSIPSLVAADGQFYRKYELEKRLALGLVRAEDIRREFQAQIRKYLSFGIRITHVDGHDHIHMFPRVFGIVAEYCRHTNIPVRISWVNRHGGRKRQNKKRILRKKFLHIMIVLNRPWRKRSLKYNQGFASIFDFVEGPEEISPELYLRILENIHHTPFELMVHPYEEDKGLSGKIRILDYCYREHEVLCRMNLKVEAERKGLILGCYDQVCI